MESTMNELVSSINGTVEDITKSRNKQKLVIEEAKNVFESRTQEYLTKIRNALEKQQLLTRDFIQKSLEPIKNSYQNILFLLAQVNECRKSLSLLSGSTDTNDDINPVVEMYDGKLITCDQLPGVLDKLLSGMEKERNEHFKEIDDHIANIMSMVEKYYQDFNNHLTKAVQRSNEHIQGNFNEIKGALENAEKLQKEITAIQTGIAAVLEK